MTRVGRVSFSRFSIQDVIIGVTILGSIPSSILTTAWRSVLALRGLLASRS
jgi:hypothetical protein